MEREKANNPDVCQSHLTIAKSKGLVILFWALVNFLQGPTLGIHADGLGPSNLVGWASLLPVSLTCVLRLILASGNQRTCSDYLADISISGW